MKYYWQLTRIEIYFSAIFLLLLFSTCNPAYSDTTPNIDMNAIKTIESSGDPHAYNKESGATGLYQITKICLDDFNRYKIVTICRPPIVTCKVEYALTIDDMFFPDKNRKVAFWYMNTRIPELLKHFEHEDTVVNRLISYKCGVGCVGKPLSKKTKRYIKKYWRIINDT